MKKMLARAKSTAAKYAAQVGAVATAASLSVNTAVAQIDVAGVTTAIGTAETSAHSVGTVIIGVIAGLAVVGIVIGLVRKL